jgi:ERF superfamily
MEGTAQLRGEIYSALSKAQEEILGALKDSDNPFFKSKYADLASVQDAIRKPFAKNGLCASQVMEPMEGGFVLVTILGHSSGQEIVSRLPVTLTDTKPQAVGSQITYARRYALAAIAGVAQIDDDGEAAHGRTVKPVVTISQSVRDDLEAAAEGGLGAFRDAWKKLTKDERSAAQSDSKWFEGLRAKAESVKSAA